MSSFSRILIIFGFFILLLSGFLLLERYTPKRLAFENFQTSASSSGSVQPSTISIPSLNINLGIYPANITKNKWEATSQGVSYLVQSVLPGDRGNSILYGHNWPSLLGNLTKIEPGAEINIFLNNQEKRVFVVKYTSVVTPDQTQLLNQTDDMRLTLYTCTGFLDSKRFVAVAEAKN